MENQKNTYALIIGIGDDLPYTIKDANNLFNNFIDKELIGYPKKNVILLTEKKATKKGILGAFDRLKKMTDKESTILLYYSGHGGKLNSNNQFYLQPYGTTLKNFYDSYLTADELKKKLNALPSNRLAFFLDCCHAEGMVQDGLNGFAKNLNDSGIWVMASCQDNQKSYGDDEKGQSFFTTCLLEVLKGKHKIPFTDPEISILDVVEYIFEEVPKIASTYPDPDKPGGTCKQTPFFKTQMSENLVLSYFTKNIENHELIIAKYENNTSELDEEQFINFIKALEAVGRVDDAITTITANKNTKSDPDLLETLGDLYRNNYLKNSLKSDGDKALRCHLDALELAISTEDEEQVFTNGIKIAFMFAKLDKNKREMRDYANNALIKAKAYLYPNINKLATIAEANIYLAKLEDAKEYYKKVGEKAGIRYRMKCYDQAVLVYNILFQPENNEDPFLMFLEEALLS